DEMNISEITSSAKDAVNRETRGATPMSMIKTARRQVQQGKDYELRGDLKSALAAYTQAAALAKVTLDHPEMKKGGGLKKEFNDFFEHEGSDLAERKNAVEDKLKAFEKRCVASSPSDDPPRKTIADRLKSLQDNGLVLTTNKRMSRELPTSPPATSPSFSVSSPSSLSHIPSSLSSVLPSPPPLPTSFVSPSTLGPPSPASTSPVIPERESLSLFEFAQNFPTIDELDEATSLSLPSVPTSPPATTTNVKHKHSINGFAEYNVPVDRPSSTPLTPIANSFGSQPASPTRSPAPPPLATKPSTVGLNKPPIPNSNSTTPSELAQYMQHYKVLLLDVRHRADFDREHISHKPIVCVEPSILMRESVTGQSLEDALVVAPTNEGVVFSNREKFDLIVLYDQNSETFGPQNSPVNVLVMAIYEGAIQKMLRRVPMLLLGGLDRWKREMGDDSVRRLVDGKHSPAYQDTNPFRAGAIVTTHGQGSAPSSGALMNGLMSPTVNGATSPPPVSIASPATSPRLIDPRQQWSSSRERYDNSATSPPLEQRAPASLTFGQGHGEHRSTIMMQPLVNGSSSITYPQFPSRVTPNTTGSLSGSPFVSPPAHYDNIASPPQASINPSFPRRRSDYIDQTQEALSGSGIASRGPIDYPELSTQISRPAPVAAPAIALDRQDNHNRSIAMPQPSAMAPLPPRLKQDYSVVYWYDTQIGTSGLKNMGNTCYMNAPIQCLSATVPFAQFFTNGRWRDAINMLNKMGSQGKLVQSFASLLRSMWQGDLPYITPIDFRKMVVSLNQQYSGCDQHDSQEFLSFLLDIIHEDLNRVITKPAWKTTPEQEAELERLPPQIASDQEWKAWKMRNDSLIVDYFQGQLRNRLECMTCHQTSTTYNVFSMLQLPVPSRSGKIHLQKCLDAFFNHEVMEKDDAWDCPRCKTKRKATKQLSLARLPPILLIHLKRFETRGRFSDKIDTFVEYPLKGLDLTNFMPPPLPSGADKGQVSIDPSDPRTQLPPYRYDLYGVTNHYGNLSSGHYTAYIASRGGWMSCDDSSVRPADPKQVVNQKAYVLFYKRVKA
ncbi:hypothetical protein PLEOSDRAFT_1043620, partial [Pleurotus ostreatus PC15]